MRFFARSSLLLTVAAGGAFLVQPLDRTPALLEAAPPGWLIDSDDDMLPDSVEWMLLSDPAMLDTDSDGEDDFLEAVQHQLPGIVGHKGMDNEMRAVVSMVREADGTGHVLLSLIFRFVSGTPIELQSFTPFIQINNRNWPLTNLFTSGIVDARARVHPQQGWYFRITSRLCSERDLNHLLPCSIGAVGSIQQQVFNTGSLLTKVDNTLVAFVPVANPVSEKFVLHPVESPQGPQGGPQGPSPGYLTFWTQSQTCELELFPMGVGSGYTVCQISDAACKGAPTLFCYSDCTKMNGNVILVPQNTRFLTTGR